MNKIYFLMLGMIGVLVLLVVGFSNSNTTDSSSCNSNPILSHIYNSSKLEVLDKCKTISGTVEGINIEDNGNVHIRLKPDKIDANLVNDVNKKYQNGNLVVEIACAYAPSIPDAKVVCANYVNKILIPHKGDHIEVIGQLVSNLDHLGWIEINPAEDLSLN